MRNLAVVLGKTLNPSELPMPNFFYTDANGTKQGPLTPQQLQALINRGTIVAATPLETDSGHTGLAGQIPDLIFPSTTESPFALPVQAPAPVNLFCTNCGNSVSEQAVACMSCGARPTGHKKFCRQCGVALNPEQVVCIKCGASFTGKSGIGGKSTGLGFSGVSATLGKVNPQILQIMTFVYIGIMIFGAAMGFIEERPLVIDFLLLAVLSGIFVFLMFQFWNLVPCEIARTTTEKAAWFSLIPFFNFYWLFVCLWGLGKDLNRTLEQRGIDSRVNDSLLLGYCIIVIAEFCFGFIVGFLDETVGVSLNQIVTLLFIGLAGAKGAAIYNLYTSSKSLTE